MIGAAVAKATALGAKYGPKVVMAGKKLGAYLGSEGVKQAGKRALRDTILYTAAEQAIPRALGQDAPPLKDTLVRQATGNIIAEGATAGLKKAFPIKTGIDPEQVNLFTGKKEGKNLFNMPGLSASDARKIGEVTGQIGGQAIAQRVLPGEQANPFLPSTYMQEEPIPLGVGPMTPTGATKFTAEPEYAEVVRPSTTDLSNVQAQQAIAERERYAYELQLAQIKNQPKHTYMHYESANPAALGAEMASKTFSNMKIPQYG